MNHRKISCGESGGFALHSVPARAAGSHRCSPFSSLPDVNECEVGNGGCESQCRNTIGSFYCKCAAGLRLARDGKACAGRDGGCSPAPRGGAAQGVCGAELTAAGGALGFPSPLLSPVLSMVLGHPKCPLAAPHLVA